MKVKLWNELGESVFNIHFLSIYVSNKRRIKNTIEFLSIFFSLLSVYGIIKFPEFYKYFTFLIVVFQLIILFRNKVFNSESDLMKMEFTRDFYLEQKLKLENLWIDWFKKRKIDSQIELEYSNLMKTEAKMIKTFKFDKIEDKKINRLAALEREKYLDRFRK